jgi:hypothetical protein
MVESADNVARHTLVQLVDNPECKPGEAPRSRFDKQVSDAVPRCVILLCVIAELTDLLS